MISLREALAEMPLIAILRGVSPEDAVDVASVLADAGFRVIEVPLNSPSPLVSIERMSNRYGSHAIVGAGTVLSQTDVNSVASAGGRIVVAPNLSPSVGKASEMAGLDWCPGVMTPSEAFAALDQGASLLKFFPAELVPPEAIGAMRAVLPKDAMVAAVGGVTPERLADYDRAGTNAYGLGSALFKPGYSLAEIAERAKRFVDAANALRATA